MEKKKLERIGVLSRLSKQRPLTSDELAEQKALRDEYRRAVVGNLTSQLESMTIVEPDGSKIKVSDMKCSGEEK